MATYYIDNNLVEQNITVTNPDDIQPIEYEVLVAPLLVAELEIIDGKRTVDYDLELPIATIKDKGYIFRGFTKTDMVNGKAKYGSSEDDCVWTVFIHTLNYLGEVTDTVIQYNQSWTEVKHRYNI